MRRFLIANTCVAFLAASTALAGFNRWSPIGPSGGDLTAIAADPHSGSTAWVGTYGGSIYRTTDGGSTWADVSTTLPAELGVFSLAADASTTPATVYAGRAGRTGAASVDISSDGGGTWRTTGSGISGSSVVSLLVDSGVPGRIYAGSNGGVFRSDDSGGSWIPARGDLPADTAVAFAEDPSGSPVFVAMQNSGVYRSTTGGSHWTSLHTGLPAAATFSSLAFSQNLQGALFVGFSTSSGGGIDRMFQSGPWTSVSTGLPAGAVVNDLKLVPGSSTTLYAATAFGASKTTNGGGSWIDVSTGLESSGLLALAVTPASPNVAWGAALQLFRTTTVASSWADVSNGIFATDCISVAADPGNVSHLLVGAIEGGYGTTDTGGHWSLLPASPSIPKPFVFDPTNPSVVYAGVTQSADAGFYKSTDGGATFAPAMAGLTSPSSRQITDIALDPTSPTTIYAGSGGAVGRTGPAAGSGVFKSTDGAASWQPLHGSGIESQDVRTVAIDPLAPARILVATQGGGVFQSADGGASWAAPNAGLTNLSTDHLVIDPVTPAYVYVSLDGTEARLAGSTDGGISWELLAGFPDVQINSLFAFGGRSATILAGTENSGIEVSTDHGATWSTFNVGLPPNSAVEAIAIDSAGTLYAGLTGAGVYSYTGITSALGTVPIPGRTLATGIFGRP